MRRNARSRRKETTIVSDKIIMYAIVGIGILTAILVGLLMYSKSLSDEVKEGTMSLEQMANISGNNTENTQSASTQIGKTVEESQNETNETNTSTSNSTSTNSITTNQVTSNKTTTAPKTTTTSVPKQSETTNVETKEETKKELSFSKPVDGEIAKAYAKDNLVYSNTLEEWTTHLGIDIKADKTTIVKSAEAGTIKSIKNDPRYGLTIVIDHEDGYQTIYSNLLTSEFVVEGEKVEKGQSIGTVGNTAVFEIADEPHLHFEILKDSIQLDPNIYIK